MEKKYISACLNALSTSISALYCWLLAGSKFSCSGRIKFRRKNVGGPLQQCKQCRRLGHESCGQAQAARNRSFLSQPRPTCRPATSHQRWLELSDSDINIHDVEEDVY